MAQKFTATIAAGVPIPGPEGPQGPAGPQWPQGPIAGYIGHINRDGALIGALTGWTTTHPATGEYHIVHSLQRDPSTYIVLVTSASDAGEQFPVGPPPYGLILHVADQTEDQVTIYAREGKDLVPFDAGFHFMLAPAT